MFSVPFSSAKEEGHHLRFCVPMVAKDRTAESVSRWAQLQDEGPEATKEKGLTACVTQLGGGSEEGDPLQCMGYFGEKRVWMASGAGVRTVHFVLWSRCNSPSVYLQGTFSQDLVTP